MGGEQGPDSRIAVSKSSRMPHPGGEIPYLCRRRTNVVFPSAVRQTLYTRIPLVEHVLDLLERVFLFRGSPDMREDRVSTRDEIWSGKGLELGRMNIQQPHIAVREHSQNRKRTQE